MSKTLLLVVPALLVSFAFAPAIQTRSKPKGPADFNASIDQAKGAWAASDYGTCMKKLQECMTLVTQKRSEMILAAFPTPSGWEFKPDKSMEEMRDNPMAGAMAGLAGAIGSMTKGEYRQADGKGRITVTVAADSPMVRMLNMAFANPAMIGKDSELIEYGAHKALLKTQNGGRLDLQILIFDQHLCTVDTRGIDDEELFRIFDQAAVDKLAAALGK